MLQQPSLQPSLENQSEETTIAFKKEMAMITWTRTCPPLGTWINQPTSDSAYSIRSTIDPNIFGFFGPPLVYHSWAMATWYLSIWKETINCIYLHIYICYIYTYSTNTKHFRHVLIPQQLVFLVQPVVVGLSQTSWPRQKWSKNSTIFKPSRITETRSV